MTWLPEQVSRSKRLLALVAWTYMLMSIGCGTWIGNPKDPGKDPPPPSGNSTITLKVHGELPTALQLAEAKIDVVGVSGSVIGSLTLTQARVALKEIKLKLTNSDTQERQEFKGPFVVDLLSNQMRPDPGTIEVDAGSYTDIKLKLAKLEKDEISGVVAENDPLIERSIYLTGTYRPDGGDPVTIVMDFDLDEEFVLAQSGSTFGGMNILEGQTNPVIIAFRLDRWFDFRGAEADLSGLEGDIVLTKDGDDAAKSVREAIKENVKQSAKFGKDDDGDGKLEDEEDSEDD